MDFDKDFASPDLEINGVWVQYEHNGEPVEGAQVKIARLGNPEWQKKHDKLMQPYRRMERDGRMPASKQTDILCRSYIGTVLLDWSGFTKKGKTFKFSEENAYKMLRERMDFRNSVTTLAAREENFRQELEDDAAKNSGTSFDGASTTDDA